MQQLSDLSTIGRMYTGTAMRYFFRDALATTLRSSLLLTVLASVSFADEPAAIDAETEIDTVLLRVALVVSDVEASTHFYSYALGYKASFDGDITRPGVIEQLQLEPGQTARFVVLRGADVVDGRELEGAMIGLLHLDNPAVPPMRRPGPATLATGEGMMALVTSDIALAYERMQELGTRVLLPPTLSADGSESEMVVYDPDGIRVHIVEVHGQRN